LLYALNFLTVITVVERIALLQVGEQPSEIAVAYRYFDLVKRLAEQLIVLLE